MDPATQAKREALITRLEIAGVLIKVDGSEVFVGSGFYALTFDEKQKVAALLLAYDEAQDSNSNGVTLRDGYTGKKIGDCLPGVGLDLD